MKYFQFENDKQEIPLSKKNVHYLAKLAFDYAGIWIDPSRDYYFYHRLSKRVKTLNLPNFDAYCNLLKHDLSHEIDIFINEITTNVTSFFREEIHFNYLSTTIIPQLMKKNEQTHKIRIWSAGCSSGEEAYSIAMVINEIIPESLGWDVKILATDINSQVLDVAREGIYSEDCIDYFEHDKKKKFFLRGKNQQQGHVLIKPEIKKMVYFKRLNLMSNWPIHNLFDLIFCRNVIIYMQKETQKILINKFNSHLNLEGFLIVGHAESVKNVCDDFILIKNSIYQKIT